ncbi:MAG: N-acetyltransferase family protein [Acidimicrobiia bacterium]
MDIADAAAEHAAGIAAVYAPVVADTVISFELDPPDADEIGRRMAASELPWLVALEGGTVIGYGYAASFKDRAAYRHTVETTVYVAEGHRRCGTGRALLTALHRRLAHLDVHLAVATIALPNPASVAIAEVAGYRPVGTIPEAGFKHGRWVDVGIWARRI